MVSNIIHVETIRINFRRVVSVLQFSFENFLVLEFSIIISAFTVFISLTTNGLRLDGFLVG